MEPSPDSASAAADLRRIWARVRSQTRNAPADAVAEAELGFYEAARGTRKTIRYRRETTCARCEPGRSVQCPACGGTRTVEEERELDLLFPSGISDGDRFQLPGDDDAYVQVHVAPRPADSVLVRAAAALGLLAAVLLLALALFR